MGVADRDLLPFGFNPVTLAKQNFPGFESDTIPPIHDIGCLRFRDTGQKVGLTKTLFDKSTCAQ